MKVGLLYALTLSSAEHARANALRNMLEMNWIDDYETRDSGVGIAAAKQPIRLNHFRERNDMRNSLKAGFATGVLMSTLSLQAIPISGSVTFGGTVTLDSGSTVAGATEVTGWFGLGGAGKPF